MTNKDREKMDFYTPLSPVLEIPQPTTQQPLYLPQPPLLQVLDWLLSSPSIPLDLRKQFYVLWENVVFGNYSEKDIKFLMSKFREWCILLTWYIPEQKWGNILVFHDEDGREPLKIDLNILLNSLEQLYYINLTRGKEGFTVKELTTLRNISKIEEEGGGKKKVFRLF